MALLDKIPDIVNHINKYKDTLAFNKRIFCVLEGQLKQEVIESLRAEMVSGPGFNRAIQRIPAINILDKTSDKLSQTYIQTVVRDAENEQDKELLKTLEKTTTTDITLHTAQKLYNAQYMCAIEPYVEDDKLRTRVMPGHTFLPYSDDMNNPLKMNVFIKLLPPVVERVTRTDIEGREDTVEVREITLFALYSDDEIMVIEEGGGVRQDKMEEMGVADGKNPFGVIPFVYINRSKFQLIPFVNQEGLDITILIAKLLTDLNHAVQFQSYSMLWSRNTNLAGMDINPGSVIDLGDRESTEHGEPEIGMIKPEVDIEQILQLTQFELSGYMAAKGIKTTNIGTMMPGREASGISKFMDEGDASNEHKAQAKIFKRVEHDFWRILASVQSYYSSQAVVKERTVFSPDFLEEFSVAYSEAKAFKTDEQKIKELKELREIKLATKRQAVMHLNPDFTSKQVDEYVAELDKEKDDEMDKMIELAGRGDPNADPAEDINKEKEIEE